MNPQRKRAAKVKRAKPKPKKAASKKKAAPPKAAKPTEPLTIRASVEVQVPASRLWSAITSPDEIIRWFTSRCEFESRTGGRVLYWWSSQAAVTPEYVSPSRFGRAAECRVEAWEPPRSFTLRPVSHWPGQVAFRVEPHPLGSRVTVEHSGWPKRDEYFREHEAGWPEFLDLLRRYLEMPEAQYESYVAKKRA